MVGADRTAVGARIGARVGLAACAVVACAGVGLAQEQAPEWVEQLRAATAALRAELRALHERVTALEARGSSGEPAKPAPHTGPGAAVAGDDSGTGELLRGERTPEELAAAYVSLHQPPPSSWEKGATSRHSSLRSLWAFFAEGPLDAPGTLVLRTALGQGANAAWSAAALRAVHEELRPVLQDARLHGLTAAVLAPPSPGGKDGAPTPRVARLDLTLHDEGRVVELRLLALEGGGRWRLVGLEAPWLADNAERGLRRLLALRARHGPAVQGRSLVAVRRELTLAGVILRKANLTSSDEWFGEDAANRLLPGYQVVRLAEGALVARPVLAGLPLVRGDRSIAERLAAEPDPVARLALAEAELALPLGSEVEAARLERARARWVLARRRALAEPDLELAGPIAAILAEDLDAMTGEAAGLLRAELASAAGDPETCARELRKLAPRQDLEPVAQLADRSAWLRLTTALAARRDASEPGVRFELERARAAARVAGDRAAEARAVAVLAGLHFDAGRLADARPALDEAAALEPATAGVLALRALLALEEGAAPGPEHDALASAAARLDRADGLALLAGVRLALARGDHDGAWRLVDARRAGLVSLQDRPRLAQAALEARLVDPSVPVVVLREHRQEAEPALSAAERALLDAALAQRTRDPEAFRAAVAPARFTELSLSPRQAAWLVRLRAAAPPPAPQVAPDLVAFSPLVGLTLEAARAWVVARPELGISVLRVLREDGVEQPHTLDLRGDRLGVAVERGVVTAVLERG